MARFGIFVLIILLNASQGAFSQNYQFLQYRVGDGLKTDIIKSIEQDSLGFIWIGSDEGLMQYNGNRFIHYANATQSQFVKNLLKLRNGRLLVLNDLGLNEIINQVDTVIFRQILPGTRSPTDSSIWYPKSIFEDSKGNLWIGEPQSVVKYNFKKIQRIAFGPEHNSSSFIRSFNFVELPDGKILISGFNGSFFLYDNTTDSLEYLKTNDFRGEINHMVFWNRTVYFVCNNGFYKVTSIDDGLVETEQILKDLNLSYLLPISETELMVNSFNNSTFIYHPDETFSRLPFKLTVVNQSFNSDDGNIWLSTEKGVILLKPEIFNKIKTESENIYVESIAMKADGSEIYFCSKEHLRMYKTGEERAKMFDIRLRGYFLSLQLSHDLLWASNATNLLLYKTSGELVSTWNFSDQGRFIFDLALDKNDKIWFTQEACKGLKNIDKQGHVRIYNENAGLPEEITVVKTDQKGIYAGSNSEKSYLYFKSFDDSVFHNMSKPVTFERQGNLHVIDIALENDTIWLATSIGLCRQIGESLEKLHLEPRFDDMLVKTIRYQKNTPYVWFSNAYGLIQYNIKTSEYNIYDESHGLPSNTINTRGLIIRDDVIWVGTASGLAYSHFNFLNLKKTPKPYIVRFSADNKIYKPSDLSKIMLPANPYLEMAVSSPAYPSKKIRYQYKLNNRSDQWIDFQDDHLVTFSKLNSGSYNLSIRAKKIDNYDWSDANNYKFKIKKAFYETWYFKLSVLLVGIFLIIITRFITSRLLRKRQLGLEKLVMKRTMELAKANENLVARNQELDQFVYSTSHDLSAPLKSIRGLINIASYETRIDTLKTLLLRMNDSVMKLEKFIKDVISYSRNARLELKHGPIPLKELVQEVLDYLSNLDRFDQIKFNIDIDENVIIGSDETRIKIILNNLISNAVKFQKIDPDHDPEITISYLNHNQQHILVVKDNGQGIPSAYSDKIFEMFYRANVSSDGSGLGLYILRETVFKLGGEVDVHSEEGKGSEFIVRFPDHVQTDI